MHGETNERIGRRLLVDDRSSHLQYLLQGISVLPAQEHTPPLILGMRVSSTEAGRPSTMLSLCTVAQAGLFLRAARLTFPSVIYLPVLRSTTLSAWCWLLQHQPGADDDFINP
jgi:hypothetical protein